LRNSTAAIAGSARRTSGIDIRLRRWRVLIGGRCVGVAGRLHATTKRFCTYPKRLHAHQERLTASRERLHAHQERLTASRERLYAHQKRLQVSAGRCSVHP